MLCLLVFNFPSIGFPSRGQCPSIVYPMDSEAQTSARAMENHWIGDGKPLDGKSPVNARFSEDRQISRKPLRDSALKKIAKTGHF